MENNNTQTECNKEKNEKCKNCNCDKRTVRFETDNDHRRKDFDDEEETKSVQSLDQSLDDVETKWTVFSKLVDSHADLCEAFLNMLSVEDEESDEEKNKEESDEDDNE